jgi:formate-dependent nitrite reductase membrane component NrfD
MSESQMVGDSFRLGYRFQRHWDVSMASAFFCGELGAGLFLVSMIYEIVPGLVLGLLITGIGKPFFHLTHMGVPGKSWRAILRPDRSWTSRGLIAIVVFTGAGMVHTIDALFGKALPLGVVFQLLAGAAALVVMTYQGFAMSHSTALGLWSTAMLPFSSLLYALTGGVIVALLLQTGDSTPVAMSQLVYMALGFLLADLIMLLSILHGAYHGSPGGRLSAELLFKTLYAKWFHGVVVAAGILLPMATLWLGNGTLVSRLLAAAGMLAGFYAFRVLIFKAGVYEPVMSFSSLYRAQDK